MATQAEQLYQEDFYAWTREQAAALRRLADERWDGPLDLLHLAEEVEDLGSEQQNAVMSQLGRIIEHLLKLEHARNPDPRRQWMISVNNARAEIGRRLTPTIRKHVDPLLSDLYRRSRRNAELSLLDYKEPDAAHTLPAACPYAFDDLLADEWWPLNRHDVSEN